MWDSVPVIVVITKSYSEPEREENIEMVKNAFDKQKRLKNLRAIIPVVASTYVLNDSAYAAPEGISELIDRTNELMPEGVKAAENDISKFILNRKRGLSHGLVGVATTAATVVGAVPIPFPDAMILAPIEIAEINSLALIYEINKDEKSQLFIDSIVEVGTVSTAAKTAIIALKAIPGINLAASVINAIIAGSIVAAIGEGTIYVFEQVYTGKKSMDDTKWVREVIEEKLSNEFFVNVKAALEQVSNNADSKFTSNIVMKVFTRK